MSKRKNALIEPDAVKAAAGELQKKASPLTGVDVGASALAKQVERHLDPFGFRKLHQGLRVDAERAIDPFGYAALHRSMATRLGAVESVALGGSAAAAIRAASSLRLDSAVRAALGGVRIDGLDTLHTKVKDLFGASDVSKAVASFTRTRDQLRGVFGAAQADRWDQLVAPTVLNSLSILSNDAFHERTAVMTWASDNAIGSFTWLDLDEDEVPTIEVAAVRDDTAGADARAWRKLRIATDSAITCLGCGKPFRVDMDLWLTSEDTVFFQGELLTLCSTCSGGDCVEVDVLASAAYRVIEGGRADSDPPSPTGKLSLIVDNTNVDE